MYAGQVDMVMNWEDSVLKGAKAAGFPTDLWTCPRVAQLIKDRSGPRYHVDAPFFAPPTGYDLCRYQQSVPTVGEPTGLPGAESAPRCQAPYLP